MSQTVREMVREIRDEVRQGGLAPERERHLLNRATSLIGNCSDEIREADFEYSKVLLMHMDAGEAANRATIRASVSPEFQRLKEAKDTLKLVTELVRSLRRTLSSLETEMRLS